MTQDSVWDEIPDRPFVRYTDGVVVVTFEDNAPTKTTNDYRAVQYNFKIEGGLLYGVSSKNLMMLLKKHRPLANKTFKVTRTGRGFETKYQVEEVVM